MEQEEEEGEGEEYTTICPCKRHVVNFNSGVCVAVALAIVPHLWLKLGSIMSIFKTLAFHITGWLFLISWLAVFFT